MISRVSQHGEKGHPVAGILPFLFLVYSDF